MMKVRYVFVILAGILITALVFTISFVSSYQPSSYRFLGSQPPKKVTLEPDPVGMVGREVRYYVVKERPSQVIGNAAAELKEIGWSQKSMRPAVFKRGSYESIDIRGADQYNDAKLLAGIAPQNLSGHTVVKVVDPRMPPALRQRFARMAKRLSKFHG